MNDIIKMLSCLAGSNCIVSTPNAFYIGKNGYTAPVKQIQNLSTKVDELSNSVNTIQDTLDSEIQRVDDQLLSMQGDLSNMSSNITQVSQTANLNKQNIAINAQSISSILATLNSNALIGKLIANSQGEIPVSTITKSGIYEVYDSGKNYVVGHIVCNYKGPNTRSFLLIGDLQVDSTNTVISVGGDVYKLIYLYTGLDTVNIIDFTQDIPSINSRISSLDTKVQKMNQTIAGHSEDIAIINADTENLQNSLDEFGISFNEFKATTDSAIGSLLSDSEDFSVRISELEDIHTTLDYNTNYPITPNKLSFGINIISADNYKQGIIIATRPQAEGYPLYPTGFLIIGGLNVYLDETYDTSYITLDGNQDNFLFIYKGNDGKPNKIDMRDIYSRLNDNLTIKSMSSNTFLLKNIKVGRQISINNESGNYLGYIQKYNNDNIFVNGFIDINVFSSISPDSFGITQSDEFVQRMVTRS